MKFAWNAFLALAREFPSIALLAAITGAIALVVGKLDVTFLDRTALDGTPSMLVAWLGLKLTVFSILAAAITILYVFFLTTLEQAEVRAFPALARFFTRLFRALFPVVLVLLASVGADFYMLIDGPDLRAQDASVATFASGMLALSTLLVALVLIALDQAHTLEQVGRVRAAPVPDHTQPSRLAAIALLLAATATAIAIFYWRLRSVLRGEGSSRSR